MQQCELMQKCATEREKRGIPTFAAAQAAQKRDTHLNRSTGQFAAQKETAPLTARR